MEASAIDTDSSITTIPPPPEISSEGDLSINKIDTEAYDNDTKPKFLPTTPEDSPPEENIFPQTPSGSPPQEQIDNYEQKKFSPHSPTDSPPDSEPDIQPKSPSYTPPDYLDEKNNKTNKLSTSTVNKLKSALDKKQRKNRAIELYSEVLDNSKILLDFKEVNKNIKTIIEQKLKSKYEKKCNIKGYVKNNSIKVINFSSGALRGGRIEFTILFQYKVCYPVEGTIINCKVKNVTKAGIRAEIVEKNEPTPLVIFIARDHNNNNDDFITIKEDENIDVKIIGKRFELNDSYISVIGELASKEIV
tara:strand:+ start:328 stop:1239 length:912 start_codon:yes stop_codon:yes gene_type:complete